MKIIGLGLDHSNICTDYNTVYLDRDNNDPATVKCMTKVLKFYEAFFNELSSHFAYALYRMNHQDQVAQKEMVKKRFFFYSLEKEITMQSFLLQKESKVYNSIDAWAQEVNNSLLIQNDEEGEGVYFYCEEDSPIHIWLKEKLSAFSLDDMGFEDIRK
jgi:protein-arginine kinase